MVGAVRPFLSATLFLFFTFFFLNPPARADTEPVDLSALQALYASLESSPVLSGWRSEGGDPCGGDTWLGVFCARRSVTSIKIRGLGVGGSLGFRLHTFLSLTEFDVSNNKIGGDIPYRLPPNATHINLAVNNFTGGIPYSLPFLKSLGHLNISHNVLSGTMPNVFTDMKILLKLDLSFNSFSGDLPSSFSTLANLQELYLQNNQFTGSVVLLAHLPLSILNLENNHFSGYVPNQFKTIPELRIDGNFFEPGYHLPPPLFNKTDDSTPDSNNKNISYSPNVSSSPWTFPSAHIAHKKQKKSSVGAKLVAIFGSFIGFLLAVTVITICYYFFYKNARFRSKRNKCYNTDTLPITMPTVPTVNIDQPSWFSSQMNLRSPTDPQSRIEKMSRRKSCSRRSRSLRVAKVFSASELESATNNYSEERLLGAGSIGHVYKAKFPDGKVIGGEHGEVLAVKKVDMLELTVHEEDEFLDTIWNLSRLNHPYITVFWGYCVERGLHILVYEYAGNGSLDDLLFAINGSQKAFSWKARLKVALGVAHALEYMHCICYPPFAHGNLKATNVLLNEEQIPHLSDYGIRAIKSLLKSSEETDAPNGYAAPELGKDGSDMIKTDVYSYGVILLELLTGRKAFDSSRRKGEQFLAKWASLRLHDFSSLEGMVDPAIRSSMSSRILSRFADIIMLCIKQEPEFRSPMNIISENLVNLIQLMGHATRRSSAEASDLSFKSTVAALEPPTSPN